MGKTITKILFLLILFISLSFQTSMTQIQVPHLKTLEEETQHQHDQTQQVIQSFNALPLYFTENNGQIDEYVKYHLEIPNANVYFTPKEIVYQFLQRKAKNNTHKAKLEPASKDKDEGTFVENIQVSFLGANEEVAVEGLEKSEAKFSYFRGNDPQKWVKGARSYHSVLYRELYPKIDLVVYGEGGKIKHEYRVRSGGEAGNIKIKYEGIEGLRVNEDGELEIILKGGKLREDVPISYQRIDGKRKAVKTEYYVMKDNIVGFRIEEYKKERELIIDPALSYSTFLGGSDHDEGRGITIDRSGNAYVIGDTWSTDFPTTPGAFDTSLDGDKDLFIAKLNSSGSTLAYSTYLGGSGDDFSDDGIAIDEDGNVYVAGWTSSSDFPTTPGAYNTIHNDGWFDVFITKLDSSGSALAYSTFLGGSGLDYGYWMAIDGSGNAFVTGRTSSSDFPTTPGAYDTSYNFMDDLFITKLNSTGSALSYSTFIGGGGIDAGWGIAIDGSGNAFVTGFTESADFPTTPSAYDTSHNGGQDVFITKLNSTGSALAYSTFIGVSGDESGWGIAIDRSGNAYITSGTESADFPTTSGAYDTSHNGGRDVFIAKLNSSGSALTYSTYLGGSGDEDGRGIAIDGSGNAYVTGMTSSSDFPTTPCTYAPSLNSGWDVFAAKLNSSGSTLAYSTYLGGSGDDKAWGIAIDGSGNANVTGQTESSDFPTTSDAYDTDLNGYIDVFVTKILIPIQLPIFDGHDFNGNGTSDASVWRPSNGRWYIKGVGSYAWGQSGDIPVNGDYNGDGITDAAVWRPSNGWWYIKGIVGASWGMSGDTPVPGNYDGDVNGISDMAVWRPSNGRWYIKGVGCYVWGTAGDIPVPGDYDGDGITDIAVWRPSNGRWYIRGVVGYAWGTQGDIPVPADYSGDGMTDIAVWRPSNGRWYIKGIGSYIWGQSGDIPAPGDYDGDGTTEIAVWRPSNGTWYIKKGLGGYSWGMIGDIPLVR